MYIACIVLIFIASILLILAVLSQSPKGGMAANFGASNQVMGVRQTADFLEKSTWGLAIAILVLSLAATMTMPSDRVQRSRTGVENAIINELGTGGEVIPNQVPATPAAPAETPATPAPATPVEETPAE
jgi:preprotein translocase subunit SecG